MAKTNIAVMTDRKGFSKKMKIPAPHPYLYVPVRTNDNRTDTVEFYFVKTAVGKGGSRYEFHEYKETLPNTAANAFVVGAVDRIEINKSN